MTPVVAVVGRQNVGKSALVNAIAGRRLSIVDAMPGVTRDRVEHLVSYQGRVFLLVDTGGIGLERGDPFHDAVEKQISYAIDHADLILFVVDVQEGVMPVDRRVAERLRRSKKEVLLIANKADTPSHESAASEFHALGFGDPFPVAAIHRRRTGELLERLASGFPEAPFPERGIRIAVVGKRNVGKSTFINALAGTERVVVNERPGTTRDAVDVGIEREGKRFVLIDTAGLRKKGKVEDSVELFSRVRTEAALDRADAVIFLLEVQRNVTEVDKRIAAGIEDRKKPCIVALNKWDLIPKGFSPQEFSEYVGKAMPLLRYAPMGIMTASRGERVWEVVETAEELYRQSGVKIPTREVNAALEAAQRMRTAAARRGKFAKIYYATQKGVRPPRFVIFVNDPRAFAPDYVRYLEGKLREFLPFPEVPIRLELRGKKPRR